MGADADQHQPLVVAVLDARRVGLRIGQARDVDRLRASSISFLVRWLMKIGLPRQNTLMTCPSAIGPRSTSIGAPAAIVEASGFICAISGTRRPRRRRRRRRCRWRCRENRGVSARPKLLSQSKSLFWPVSPPARRTANALPRMRLRGGGRAGRPWSWGRTKDGDPAAFIGTLAERSASPPRAAMSKSRTNRSGHPGMFRAIDAADRQGRNDADADRPLRARHPAEHRNDSAPVRLPRRRGPHHRADRLSGLRPRLPPRRHGLPRSGGAARGMRPGRPSRRGGARERLRLVLFTTARDDAPISITATGGRHPAVRPRIRRRAGRGACGRRCAARDPDAAGPALAQCRDGRGDGAGRGAAADGRRCSSD